MVVLFTLLVLEVALIIMVPQSLSKGCLKIHLVDFDCEMGTGSNPSQLR